jgi:arylsulfate sulfotransferase
MMIRRISVWSALFSAGLLTLVTVGCGSGSSGTSNPESSISATQNPLVAQYNLALPIPSKNLGAWVEFGTDTTYGRQTSTTAATTSLGPQTIAILVAGMKASTTYHMRAHVEWYGGGSWVDQDQTFTTGALPTKALAVTSGAGPLIVPIVAVTRPGSKFEPSGGVELIDITPQGPPTHLLDTFVTDLEGNVIWYYDVGAGKSAFPIRPISNGHFILGIASGLDSLVIREIDLAGSTVREVNVAQINQSLQNNGYTFSLTAFHHDVIVLPNGHWIAIAQTVQSFTDLPGYPGTTNVSGDVVIDIDLNGNVAWAWSAFDHLDVNRHLFGLPDWTHSNALVYTRNDGNLLLSMRNQSWILKIEYENGSGSGNVLWRLGNAGDFTLSGNDPGQWFYAQHFPSPVNINGSQMTVAVFDDGNLRVLNENGVICGTPGYDSCVSRATIYQLDESTKTASLDWQFFNSLFTPWGGSINQLANGNVEFDMPQPFLPEDPTASLIQEVTQTTNPTLVWQMTVTGGNAYRAYRIPSLYPGVAW